MNKAHQLLHGYKSGHGQIAGSIKLDDRDSDLVTRLSDLSGSLSSGIKFLPYLTAYRVPSRRYFAIARTWPDPDAPRAGCVLTHTILIPTDEWAKLSNLRGIDRLFKNPRSAPEHEFGEPLSLPLSGPDFTLRHIEVDSIAAETFVSRYFGQGMRPIVWFNAENPEEYLWRILEHLWPRLRSVFSCCTFSLQQRTLEDGPFDLLFAPSAVYSRFTKLPLEHLIEASNQTPKSSVEPWCQYWANALFSSQADLPSDERELPVWDELEEDPTAIRKLSLVHELRLRAASSPTAGVGAIDVVESLARDPEAAVHLKRQVFGDAIDAAVSAQPAEDSLTALRLIDDRLGRDSFRKVASNFENRLTAAATEVTIAHPEAALQVKTSWFTDSVTGSKSAFVQGVMTGLQQLARKNPERLTGLASFPDVAAEIFRLVPTFGSTYLKIGGEAAHRVLTDWLSSTRDEPSVRAVRNSIVSSHIALDNESLLVALLRNIPEKEIPETLSRLSNQFSNSTVRQVITERVSPSFPRAVREWAQHLTFWSPEVSDIVAATYPNTRVGLGELLDEQQLGSTYVTQTLVAFLRHQLSGGFPYWLRETVSQDARILNTLMFADSSENDEVETLLSGLISAATDLPFSRLPGLLDKVLDFGARPIFSQLLDSAMRSAVIGYVADGVEEGKTFCHQPAAQRWLNTVSGSLITALLVRGCASGQKASYRAWEWTSEAPSQLYRRAPSILPELCDSLLTCVRHAFPQGVEIFFTKVLSRCGSESTHEVHQMLSGKMLRFSLDNTRFPLGSVVADAFPDVYGVAIKKESRPPSFFAALFGAYDWDRGKDLRVSLIDAFLRSNWAPGDLALAATNAGIFSKVFKRLHRTHKGEEYIKMMVRDLGQRSDDRSREVLQRLRTMVADPDFYEEWD